VCYKGKLRLRLRRGPRNLQGWQHEANRIVSTSNAEFVGCRKGGRKKIADRVEEKELR